MVLFPFGFPDGSGRASLPAGPMRPTVSQSPAVGASPGDLRSAERRGRETLAERRPTVGRTAGSGNPRRTKQIRNESSPDLRAVKTNFAACQGEAPAGLVGTLGSAEGPAFRGPGRNAGVRTPEILGKIVPIGRLGL